MLTIGNCTIKYISIEIRHTKYLGSFNIFHVVTSNIFVCAYRCQFDDIQLNSCLVGFYDLYFMSVLIWLKYLHFECHSACYLWLRSRSFFLHCGECPMDGELLAFLRVFCMDEGKCY